MLKIEDISFFKSLEIIPFPDYPYEQFPCLVKCVSFGGEVKIGISEKDIDSIIECLNKIRKETSKTSDAAKSVDVDKRGS